MSDAFKCDRCGELLAGQSDYAILHGEHNGRYRYEDTICGNEFEDLCENCHDKLEQFMDGVKLRIGIPTKTIECELEYTPENIRTHNHFMDIEPFSIEESSETVLKELREVGGRNY